MKGEITLKFNGIDDITVAVKTTPLHKLEKLILIDALCESLRLENSEERFVIGTTIAVGGMKAVSGENSKVLEIDMKALRDALRKDKNNNETDAH